MKRRAGLLTIRKSCPKKLGYGKSPSVITNVMFEEQKKAKEKLNNVAFIQCAGSRDPEHLPYCFHHLLLDQP